MWLLAALQVDFMYDISQGKHMPAKQGISFLDCRYGAMMASILCGVATWQTNEHCMHSH